MSSEENLDSALTPFGSVFGEANTEIRRRTEEIDQLKKTLQTKEQSKSKSKKTKKRIEALAKEILLLSSNPSPSDSDTSSGFSNTSEKITASQSKISLTSIPEDKEDSIISTSNKGKEAQKEMALSKNDAWERYLKLTDTQREAMINKCLEQDVFGLDGKAGDYDANKFAEMIAYQGFDPMAVACMIMFRIGNDETRVHDIAKMVQIGLERGNNIDNMMKNSTPELITLLTGYKKDYQLIKSARGNKKAVTLSRVCLVFPHVACTYMTICKSPTVRYDVLTSRCPGYPKQLMTAAFGGLIPLSSDASEALTKAHLVHQYEFTKAISPDKRNFDHSSAIESAIRFVEAARNGSIMSESRRFKFMEDWNLLIKGKPSPVVEQAAGIWDTVYMTKNF